jgi:BASS family bile acid:Na+ symporter
LARRAAPRLSERTAPSLALAANLALLVVVVLLLVKEHETLAAIRPRGWFGMLLLLSASLAIGWLCGGPGRATRRSLAVVTAARNAAVALVIVAANFAGTPAVTAVIAYSVVSIFGTLGVALLFGSMSGPAASPSTVSRP